MIFDKYQWLNTCTGVELHLFPDGSYACRTCSVSLAGNLLNIDSKSEHSGDLASLLKKVPKDKPVALSLTGKGVLIRKTAKIEEIGRDKLNEVFPNLQSDQFYVQNFVSGDLSFVAIIRRDVSDQVLAAFAGEGLNVLLLTAGPFAASAVLRQLNTYGDELCFDGHCVQYTKEWDWTEYRFEPGKKSEFPLKVGMEALPGQFLIAYASAFQLALYPRLPVVSLPAPQVERHLDEFEQKQRFNFRAVAVLSGFFVLLLLNFLLFSYFNSANEALLSQVSQTSASLENLQHTEKEIASNEKLLQELGWNKGIRLSYLADQLGQTLPSSLKLKEIGINPLNVTETGRQRKEIYDTGKIKIRGEASDPAALNNWIYILKEKDWAKQVNLDSFSPSGDDHTQEFTITINY